MKQIYFILAVIFLLATCKKDKCIYEFDQRELNLVPYETDDILNATLIEGTTQGQKTSSKLVVETKEILTLNNRGALGGAFSCDGTYELLSLSMRSVENSPPQSCNLYMNKAGGVFIFTLEIENNSNGYTFQISPFDPDHQIDSQFNFHELIPIDNTSYSDVYEMFNEYDTLYYSAQTGLIKLIYPDGVIKFELQ